VTTASRREKPQNHGKQEKKGGDSKRMQWSRMERRQRIWLRPWYLKQSPKSEDTFNAPHNQRPNARTKHPTKSPRGLHGITKNPWRLGERDRPRGPSNKKPGLENVQKNKKRNKDEVGPTTAAAFHTKNPSTTMAKIAGTGKA